MQSKRFTYSLFLALIAGLVFIPFLGGVHLFDWDEINFAEISREMIVSGNFFSPQINFEPFWEKPPLFNWFQVLTMKLFGINEFAARLPNAICGIITIVFLYRSGNKLYNHRFGLLWALVYMGTILPHLYFRSGIIDPIFNLFIFTSLYYLILFYWNKERFKGILKIKSKGIYLLFAGLLCGLAILTKGPVAYLLLTLSLACYWVLNGFRFYISVFHFLLFTFFSLIPAGLWFGIETLVNGFGFLEEFVKYQIRLLSSEDAGHGGFFGYHFVVLLLGCFPASILAIRAFFKMKPENHGYQNDFKLWMKILFWVVLVVFTIVQTKIVHYSSLAYFPLTFLATLCCYHLMGARLRFYFWQYLLLILVAIIFTATLFVVPVIGTNPEMISSFLDKIILDSILEQHITWPFYTFLPGIFFMLIFIQVLLAARGNQPRQFVYSLFIGNALFLVLAIYTFVPKIEKISQGPLIDFMKSKANEDVHILTYGFKSYANYFYGQKSLEASVENADNASMINNSTKRQVYIVSRARVAEPLRNNPRLREIGKTSRYVFFEKKGN